MVFDHINYVEWGSVYLADMNQLEHHPDAFAEFTADNFVVKKTNGSFIQLPTDLALEHVNKVSKMADVIVGITKHDSARNNWCLMFNEKGHLVEQT